MQFHVTVKLTCAWEISMRYSLPAKYFLQKNKRLTSYWITLFSDNQVLNSDQQTISTDTFKYKLDTA